MMEIFIFLVIGVFIGAMYVLHRATESNRKTEAAVKRHLAARDAERQKDLAAANEAAVRWRNSFNEAINGHIKTLSLRRKILVTVDHYGVVNAEAWEKESENFLQNAIYKKFGRAGSYGASDLKILNQMIDDYEIEQKGKVAGNAKSYDHMSPVEFEIACRDILEHAGWSARLTAGSGDQGADVVAERSGVKLIIQCKLYAGAVGNKAVQEATSAKIYYGADKACVVNVGAYTKSARQLAAASEVALLHFDELPDFAL